MVKGLYTAHTGMVNEMKRLDILANNLANADTTAYKKEGTTSRTFADEMSLRIKDSSNMGIPKKLGDITYGVHLGQVYTDYSTGNFKVTDNTTDFAIEGNGFFAVAFTDKQGNTSVKYTRDGAFTVNKEGYLVTKDGDYVLNATGAMNGDPGQNNYIRLDPNASITVNKLGYVMQNNQIVGTIGMVDYYGSGVVTVLIFYLCRQIPYGWIGEVAGLAFLNCKLLGGMTIPLTLGSWTLEFPEQGLALLALIPIWLYNGRQGVHNKAIQYACYLFYPAHMLILALLRMYL